MSDGVESEVTNFIGTVEEVCRCDVHETTKANLITAEHVDDKKLNDHVRAIPTDFSVEVQATETPKSNGIDCSSSPIALDDHKKDIVELINKHPEKESLPLSFLTCEHNYCCPVASELISSEENKLCGCDTNNGLLEPDSNGSLNDCFQTGFVSSMIEVVENVEVTCEADSKMSSKSESDDDSSDSDSDSSSSSTETTSDDDLCATRIRHQNIELEEEIAASKNAEAPRVKGEILPCEQPPVEDIHISLPQHSILEAIGKITQIMPDHSIVIQSCHSKPALDFDTILFFSKDLAIGKVDETFGPVPSPYYVIRFNSEEHLLSKGVELEREVFYAPHIQDFTSFVFVAAVKQNRGSDASWCNDQEPPISCLDYSDDEQERDARRRRKNPGPNAQSANGTVDSNTTAHPLSVAGGRGRGRKREHWHNPATRVNTMIMPDQPQARWQAANNGFVGPPPPPNLFTCFQRPPPACEPPPPYSSMGQQRFQRYQAPAMNWNEPFPQFPPPMFTFEPPPPPPP